MNRCRRLGLLSLAVAQLLCAAPAAAAPLLDEIVEARGSLTEGSLADDLTGLRKRTVREAAFTIAFQSAVWHRKEALAGEAEALEATLGQIYDLGRLLLNTGKVLPPVIEEAGAAMRLHSDQEMTESALTWRILRPARLVSAPPSWRDYLLGDNPEPGRIHAQVLPKDEVEQQLWRRAAREGWEQGLVEADAQFRERVAALERDYTGMVRFKWLADQGVVEVPVLAEGELGIVVEGNRLSVDERVFRIQRPGRFNTEFETWKAQPIPTSR